MTRVRKPPAKPKASPKVADASAGKATKAVRTILERMRGDSFVIVTCDPGLADMLRQTHMGIGHRSHLDPRFWISIDLAADLPLKETRKLIEGSLALVYAKLTRRQREELDAL